NRRVMEKVNHLVFVSDASRKGLDVIRTIDTVAKELVVYDKAGVILNRLHDPKVAENLDLGGLELLAAIGEDPLVQSYDIEGKSLLTLPDDTPLCQGVRTALRKMEIIA
ncbi:MAG: hypothetical protein J5941_04160, partial [Solobacterium sp.]|nr:hypothetical protein [Solobacterium sp.]